MIRKLYIKEGPEPAAKKAMTNIVKRGVAASPPAEKQWGDALMKAVDTFDVQVRDVGSKKAPAAGKKPAAVVKAEPKKQEPEPDLGLDDPWFQSDDEPELGAAGPGEKPGKKAKASPAPEPKPDDDFPDLPAPKPASFDVGGDEEEYRSPFGHIGGGGSSWENVPDWMRDPERMPMAGGGSRRIPSSTPPEGPASGPSPVGRPWTDKDLEPKKQGLLGRLFGRKK